MEKLKQILNEKIKIFNEKTNNEYNLSEELLEQMNSAYPFNPFEYVMSHLLSKQVISLEEYYLLRKDYLARNKYIALYEMAPRTFGEKWGQTYLSHLVPELESPSTELDKDYEGQYDLWYKGIRIEVKASRAVKKCPGGALITKAIASDSKQAFNMNFQQLKPACCDVFIWIAVWTDVIKLWVLSSDEVENNPHYSPGQHRGNQGEGQLWIKETNIKKFDSFQVEISNILEKIEEKAREMEVI